MPLRALHSIPSPCRVGLICNLVFAEAKVRGFDGIYLAKESTLLTVQQLVAAIGRAQKMRFASCLDLQDNRMVYSWAFTN